MENPLVVVLARMEHVGVAVDGRELLALHTKLTADCERLSAELQRVVGRPFNFNSPIQLREILYTERGLSPGKKTKTGFSTDAATLEKLRDQWPEFIDPLLQYREVEKLRGTYGEGLLAEVAADGRIHATFIILRQHHMSGLAATHFLGRGGVGGQQARVAGIGLGLRSDQLAIGGKARGVDHLDRQSRATQSLDQCFLVAAGRLDRDADDLLLTQPRNEGGDGIGAVPILGGTTPMPRRFEA